MKPRRCTVQSLPRFRYIVYVTFAILDSDFRQIGERVERFGIESKKRGSGITHMPVSAGGGGAGKVAAVTPSVRGTLGIRRYTTPGTVPSRAPFSHVHTGRPAQGRMRRSRTIRNAASARVCDENTHR